MAPTIEKAEDDLVSASIREMFDNLLKDYGITVSNVDITAGSIKGDNYLGVIAKAEVTGTDKTGKAIENSYIIKSAPRSEGLRKFAPIRLAYEREIYVYSNVLPQFEIFQKEKHIKDPFASYAKYLKSSDQEKDEALIMTDMKALGYVMQNRKQPLDLAHMKLIFHELARLHALSFALRDQQPEIFENFCKNMEKNYFAEIEKANFEGFAVKQCDQAQNALNPETDQHAIEKFKVFRETYVDNLATVLEDHCHPYSVIRHGDCWTNNFLFAYLDEANPKKPTNLCFLDWQLSHVGPPVLDLLYLTYATTDKKLRDEHFDQLIRDYYETLKNFTKVLGTDLEKHYSFEILQDQLKKFGKYGLAIGIMLLHLLLSDSEEIPDINEIFEGENMDDMMEAFSFDSKNMLAYNTRIRDVILHVVEKGYL